MAPAPGKHAESGGPGGLYAVWASDRADALPRRQAVREAHRVRLRQSHAVTVLLAGPTLAAADGAMNGTLLVVRADSEQAVRDFINEDPYVLEAVYERVEIRPWHCGLGVLAAPR
jgi:uncharacterized protein